MTEAHAAVSKRKGINPVWLVPIVAIVLGVWMVIYTIQDQGPTIEIRFSTAEGIEEGKTKIKMRNIELGVVDDVRLGEDQDSVIVQATLEAEAEPLLREDTQFWVVRPRIGKGGISGLSTLLSGGYIKLAPGTGAEGREEFIGLEEPPVTPAGTPGLRVSLTTDRAGSIGPGDAVLYKGYQVGRVETEIFDSDAELLRYDVFIDAPYNEQLTRRHRFWDVSGVTAQLSADGIVIDTGSVETILFGGVEVGLPKGVWAGKAVEPGETFKLYESYAAVNEQPYRHSMEYVVTFPQSVRGLSPGAPVEYRGLQLGQVERVMVSELTSIDARPGGARSIPVLLRIEPARIEMPDSPEGLDQMRAIFERAVPIGMRASLVTGNLLTGSLFVTLDFFEGAEPAEMGEYAGRPTIPTVTSGLEGIAVKLTMFLDKLNQLPLDGTVREAKQLLASFDRLVAGEKMQSLPDQIDQTLAELRTTASSFSGDSELQSRLLPVISELEMSLSSLRSLLTTLDQQPNALIFDTKYGKDPSPSAGSK